MIEQVQFLYNSVEKNLLDMLLKENNLSFHNKEKLIKKYKIR